MFSMPDFFNSTHDYIENWVFLNNMGCLLFSSFPIKFQKYLSQLEIIILLNKTISLNKSKSNVSDEYLNSLLFSSVLIEPSLIFDLCRRIFKIVSERLELLCKEFDEINKIKELIWNSFKSIFFAGLLYDEKHQTDQTDQIEPSQQCDFIFNEQIMKNQLEKKMQSSFQLLTYVNSLDEILLQILFKIIEKNKIILQKQQIFNKFK